MTASVSSCCRPTNYVRYNSPYCRNQWPDNAPTCPTAYPYSATAANCLHRLKELLRELDRFSPAEIELYRRMELLNGNSALYAQDNTGLISLNAAVLSLTYGSNTRAEFLSVTEGYSADAVSPAGRLLDVKI